MKFVVVDVAVVVDESADAAGHAAGVFAVVVAAVVGESAAGVKKMTDDG